MPRRLLAHGILVAFLVSFIGAVSAHGETKKIVIFPVIDPGARSYDFGWDSALSRLAQILDDELGSHYSLVPQYQVTRLCGELWRHDSDLTSAQIRRGCEERLAADLSIGIQVTRFRYDTDDYPETRTVCTGVCETYRARHVGINGRVLPYWVLHNSCDYREAPYVLHTVTTEAELEVHFFVYDVTAFTTILSRHKRMRSDRTHTYAETDEDIRRLRQCPDGPLENSPHATRPITGVPFGRPEPPLDAHDLLAGQWRSFSKRMVRELARTLSLD